MLSKILWISGASIFLLLGALHLYYTFLTTKFDPRNKNLIGDMKNTSPRLTNETTMWKAWTGFNASHSAGAIFIGLINIILAAENFSAIENSFLLSFCTILTSVFYLWLAKKILVQYSFYRYSYSQLLFYYFPIIKFLPVNDYPFIATNASLCVLCATLCALRVTKVLKHKVHEEPRRTQSFLI